MPKHTESMEELIKLIAQYSALKTSKGCNHTFESLYKDSVLIRLVELEPSAVKDWLAGEIHWLKRQISVMEKL